jgi:hypothetical protein
MYYLGRLIFVHLIKEFNIIFKSKHRVRRTLSQCEKRDMQQRIEIELENMAHLSRPYLTEVCGIESLI